MSVLARKTKWQGGMWCVESGRQGSWGVDCGKKNIQVPQHSCPADSSTSMWLGGKGLKTSLVNYDHASGQMLNLGHAAWLGLTQTASCPSAGAQSSQPITALLMKLFYIQMPSFQKKKKKHEWLNCSHTWSGTYVYRSTSCNKLEAPICAQTRCMVHCASYKTWLQGQYK